MRNKGLPYVLLLSSLFGTSLISSRFALREFKSLQFIGLRMIISCICFVLIFSFSKKWNWPKGKTLWKHGLILGVIGTTIPMTLFISSLNYLSSGMSAIIGTAGPAVTVVLAHFLIKGDDALTTKKVLGVSLAVGGAIMLSLSGQTGLADSGSFNPIGYLMVFGSNISSSFGIIYARKNVRDLSAFEITSVRVLTTAVLITPLAWYLYGFDFASISPVGYAALVYSSIVSSFFGFILSLYIINTFGISTSIMTNYCVPVIAAIGGALVLNEQITPIMVGGMAIIICGIYIINSSPRQIVAGGQQKNYIWKRKETKQ